MPEKWDNPKTEALLKAVLALRNTSEAKRFFRDLLTEAELIEFGNRWQTAKMLDRNIPYSTITAKTGLSSTTIARVSQWLNNGMGGYKLILNKLAHHHGSSSFEKGLG